MERLQAIVARTSAAKEPDRMESNRAIMTMVSKLPAPVIGKPVSAAFRQMEKKGTPPASTAVSNVMSFREPRYMAGAEIIYMGGFAMLLPGMRVIQGMSIYNGKLHFSITTCPEAKDDTATYVDMLEESFNEYLSLLAKPKIKATTKRAKKSAAAS